MKKICKIELENSRAYYDRLSVSLDNGENLLLYGENGSGKTSLYRALDDFIQSFYAPIEYIPNRYKPKDSFGEVKLFIGDLNPVMMKVENVLNFAFSPGLNNTNVANTAYLKALALSKGFLNYRDLLKVYLYDENDPNLFDFFVNHLLGNHIPLAQGLENSLAKEWIELNQDIINVYNRQERRHRKGLRRLHDYEVVLRSVLDNLFMVVNRYLDRYFKAFGLKIGYSLKPMSFNYGRGKKEWMIQNDLRLKIDLGTAHINHYTDGLNEARLSAIAICLYLAALRANPGGEMRLMFLDDIFIGIDSANRLPILEILDNEFKDFQIIIATYDRSWYCMAKGYISNHASENWKYVNLFSLLKKEGGMIFPVPVKTEGVSSFDHAKEYLHGNREIDLPAAANYFRKALEELLTKLPKELFLSDDYTIIPEFKLSQRVESVRKWFKIVGMNEGNINCVATYLHPLIHPLSHYDEEAQIYRSELMEIEKAIDGLFVQVNEFPKKCRLLFGKGNNLCIQYSTADESYISKYFVKLDDNLWLYKDGVGDAKFADCKCRMIYMDGEENGYPLKPYIPSRNTKFNYVSLDDALRQIYEYEVNIKHHNVISCVDYDKVFYVKDKVIKTCIQVRRNELLAQM
ncbi:MAG: ATP-binding protein [Bacteroidales bacterium]|nr:ATP-binding protein [Bacteroidales bacterium]